MRKNLLKVLFFAFLVFSGWEAFGQTQTITTTGVGTFTVPDGVTSITVEVWGAGGAGGTSSGGGGGGGAYSSITFSPAAASYNFSIGAGGNSGNRNGGSTWFSANNILLAAGGIGGENNNGGGGAGGLASTGFGSTRTSGATGANRSGSNGGNGGNSPNGGNGGAGGGNGNAGNAGANPGGGGGGSGNGNTSVANGGNGQIRITWTCSNTISSAPAIASQTPCINTAITPITYTIVGAYGATVTGLPAGVTSNYNSGLLTISGSPTVSGTFNYTVTPVGSCTSSTRTGTITVTQNNSATAPSSTPNVCLGSSIPNITHTTIGATGISNAGVSGANGLPPGVSATWAGNTITISGTPTSTGTFGYNIPMTGGCGTVNATGTITVNAVPAISSQVTPGNTTCINGTAFSQMSVGTGFGYTYQWYSNTANSNSGGTIIPAATSNTYTPPSNVANTRYYYVVVSSPSCTSVTSPVSGAYIVTPSNTAGAASSTPTVCINSPLPIDITHSTAGATGIGSVTGLPAGVNASWAGDEITINGSPTVSGIFNYSIQLSGGCGTINATGTITVNATAAITTPSLAAQTECIGQAFDPISVGTGQGWTYQWYSNDTPDYDTPTELTGFTSNSYTPLSTTDGTSYYYVVVSSPTCGTSVTSAVSGAFVVNPLPVVSFDVEPTGTACVDTNITYETQAGQLNYVWTIPGVSGTDYTIVSGGTSTSNTLTLQWLSPGNKSVTVNYQDANGCGSTTPATSSILDVQENTATVSSDPHPSSCFIDRIADPANAFTSFTHTTTLATGIGAPIGLPTGLTAAFSGNTITINGTVAGTVAPGIYPYSIPLTGGCGTVSATGFIDVQPEYVFESITSVSPSNVGGTATVRFNVDSSIVPDGDYELTYSLGLANSGGGTIQVTITNSIGVFSSAVILSEDLTSLTISQIRKVTDDCFVPLSVNNITFFGIRSAVYPANGTFYVPAGIFEITIKVWGGGGAGGNGNNGAGGGGGGYTEVTVPVTPGEAIGLFIGAGGTNQGDGGVSYATRDSSDPNPQNTSLAFANGGEGATGQSFGDGGGGNSQNGQNGASGNGQSGNAQIGGKGGNGGSANGGEGGNGGAGNGNRPGESGEIPGGGGGGGKGANGGNGGNGLILISYPLPPVGSCFRVIDDGAVSGTAIIEFTCENMTWTAPEGLTGFQVTVGGAGGGGGFGSGSGGGGAGQILLNLPYSTTNPAGFPAGTSFEINVGQGGLGATSLSERGEIGGTSTFSGTIDGTPIPVVSAEGGGGGASRGNGLGMNGASGGGGAATPTPAIGFNGGNGNGSLGSNGGRGDAAGAGAHAGGGGGGIRTLGLDGQGAGAGQGKGGDGGHGRQYAVAGLVINYGAGGGGIGNNFNGVNKFNGEGGKVFNLTNNTLLDTIIGGDGNQENATSIGQQGTDRTGSGGGAGFAGGGRGGNGVVYITYDVFRILNVEYQHFTAKYNLQDRSGELTWTTSKEWETSHFEVERAVNNVNTWTKVGEVAGAGYSDSPIDYTFTDSELPATGGNIFYRLRQVGLDGDFGYSVTRSIQVNLLEGASNWIAYPNPSEMGSMVSVALLADSEFNEGNIQVRISDVRGVYQTYTVNNPRNVTTAVNSYLENARPGMYILQILWGNKSEQLKLVRK